MLGTGSPWPQTGMLKVLRKRLTIFEFTYTGQTKKKIFARHHRQKANFLNRWATGQMT